MGRTILIIYVHKVIDVYEVSQSNVLCTLNLLQVCLICQKGTLLWQGSMFNLKQGNGLKDAQNVARLDGTSAVLTQKHTNTWFCLKYSPAEYFPLLHHCAVVSGPMNWWGCAGIIMGC